VIASDVTQRVAMDDWSDFKQKLPDILGSVTASGKVKKPAERCRLA
jgi:hypothetical protein